MNKNYLNFKTDMADERVDTYKRVHNMSDIDGIIVTKEEIDGINIVTVEVINENGEKAIGKEIGKYITLELYDADYISEEGQNDIIENISEVLKDLIKDKKSIFVVGLGNSQITPDALGPKVIESLEVNRHLFTFAKELVDENENELSAVSPGVLGTTGIETSEIVESIVSKIKPDIAIVIDSLASQSMDRVGRTIQISNTGISPGSGIKNKRKGLNKETLNIPVIALGVPTVVDMATITNGALDKVIEQSKDEVENYTNSEIKEGNIVFNLLNSDNRYQMIANTLDTENYIVTPKDIDSVISIMSKLIASSINSIK